jgi:hypothetical protein
VLHLLAVSKDLSWFAHEHPTRRADGAFTMPMTFPPAASTRSTSTSRPRAHRSRSFR